MTMAESLASYESRAREEQISVTEDEFDSLSVLVRNSLNQLLSAHNRIRKELVNDQQTPALVFHAGLLSLH